MKTIGDALKAHLANAVTTLAICWQLIRTDGTVYSFTAFDEDLVVGGVTYKSTAGFTRTAIQTGSAGEVDNLEVVGFFGEDSIVERDLKNGLFDYARVYLFAVNWADLSQGIIRLRRGWIGECTLSPSGAFLAELRGLTQALVQEFGTDYMPICRADLGDAQCKIPLAPPIWFTPWTAIDATTYTRALTQPDDTARTAIFQAAGPGAVGPVEPAWNFAVGATTTDGTVTWICRPAWRTIGTVLSVLDQHRFIPSTLVIPANPSAGFNSNNGGIGFNQVVVAGATIEVSDGAISHGLTASSDTSPSAAATFFAHWVNGFTDWKIVATQAGNVVYLVNSSGLDGFITATGDTQGGIIIRNFNAKPFEGGTVTWISGDNAGRSMEVKAYDSAGMVTLWLGMYFTIQVGDRFYINPGCNKRRDTCLNTFNNIVNFRGEPDMPMMDKVLSYPQAGA